MTVQQQEKRVVERRQSARRGSIPELSLEEIYDGSLDLGAGHDDLPENRRRNERRAGIRRVSDRELQSLLDSEEIS